MKKINISVYINKKDEQMNVTHYYSCSLTSNYLQQEEKNK